MGICVWNGGKCSIGNVFVAKNYEALHDEDETAKDQFGRVGKHVGLNCQAEKNIKDFFKFIILFSENIYLCAAFGPVA